MDTKDLNLVWIDLEMTGLDTINDHIIEIATIITDKDFNILAQGPVFAIAQPQSVLDRMDAWNQQTHGASGLVKRIQNDGVSLAHAEQETLRFISQHVNENKSPLAGNSICQDRRFLFREMPKLETYLHYRNFDVSTIKEVANRIHPTLLRDVQKQEAHTALADIIESIEEMKFYRDHFFKTP